MAAATLKEGSVTGGVYRNQLLGFTCKIPEGWVLRTDEMNAREENDSAPAEKASDAKAEATAESKSQATINRTGEGYCSGVCGRVLLAAFSRPPAARGEDVNSSILIATENAASYPGLKEAGQYLEPITEVAKAQGLTVDEEPYEIAVGTTKLVRADFHKDVGSRVMRQSTLVMLTHGQALSITLIAGTEDEVEELIDGLDFATGAKK